MNIIYHNSGAKTKKRKDKRQTTIMSEIPKSLKFHRPTHFMRPEYLISDSKYSSIYYTKYQKNHNKFTITKICAAKILKRPEEHSCVNEIEYHLTKNLDHPHVMKPLGIYKGLGLTIIYYPWMQGGSLMQWIDKQLYISEHDLSVLFKQMVSAVSYIHSVGIMHQDIKPDNFLLTPDGHVKLADFGLARYHPPASGIIDTCGSPIYMAPEVMMRKPHTYSADVWSLGICLYEMYYGITPFDHVIDEYELLNEIQKPIKYPKNPVSPELIDLLMRMLSFYAICRISIAEIKNHGWLHLEPNTGFATKKIKTNRIPKLYKTL